MYEGLPVIEAPERKALEKKLEKMETRPEKVVVRRSNKTAKNKKRAFAIIHEDWYVFDSHDIATIIIPDSVTEIGEAAFCGCTA